MVLFGLGWCVGIRAMRVGLEGGGEGIGGVRWHTTVILGFCKLGMAVRSGGVFGSKVLDCRVIMGVMP
ncbi:hypothetical protein AAZX31_02G161400 [Glycine max]|nr:hypothetical protein GLYMA_02G170432v4 [Glycine max]KAH1060752.1 hypothetical protein GYH30_004285 [Glycine max]